jgi:hypothetical protein
MMSKMFEGEAWTHEQRRGYLLDQARVSFCSSVDPMRQNRQMPTR